MQTLFKSNLFSKSSSKVGAKNFLSGGKKLGSSIVGAARNNIIGFNRTAKAMVPQKKEENENSFIKNYTNFFGSKKTEKILRKNLKLVRDSLVNTFEIAKLLKASIISITGDFKGKGGGILSKLAMVTSLISLLLNPTVLTIVGLLAAGGIAALLWNEKTRTAIMNFLEYQLPKFWDWFKPRIINLVKSMMPWIPDWMWNISQEETTTRIKERVDQVGVEQVLAELKEELASKIEMGSKPGEIAELKEQIFMLENNMKEKQYGITPWQLFKGVPGMSEEMRLKRIEIRTQRENSPENDKSKEYKDETNAIIKSEMEKIRAKWKAWGDEDEKHGLPRRDQHMILKDKNLAIEQQEKRIQLAKEGNPAYQMYLPKTNTDIEGKKSDVNNLDFSKLYSEYSGALNDGSIFNLQPFTFDLSQKQDSSGGITNTSGGSSPSGNAVTFFASSNSDPTYHKLNALMTFNIV